MITLVINDALVRPSITNRNEWLVMHPSNGAILAYCDTEREAMMVRDRLTALAALLRMESSLPNLRETGDSK